MPVMYRCLPYRLKNFIARRARNRAHGDRRVRWAKGGCAHRWNIGIQSPSEHRQTINIRQFPLIRRHAQCGVAFGMFDAFKPLLRRQLHIADLDVILEIQPRF